MARRPSAKRLTWFALALLLQAAIVGGVALAGHFTATTGKVVRLEVEPVDPRDPLRGDYLTFTYAVGRLSSDTFQEPPKVGTTVYVPVVRSGEYWTADWGVSTSLDAAKRYASGVVALRGVVTSVKGPDVEGSDGSRKASVLVDYGAQEIFIPEGSGANFPVAKAIAVEARVDDQGLVQPKRVLVNGRPWEPRATK
jgi:uncharacterized membrane-anchored protein